MIRKDSISNRWVVNNRFEAKRLISTIPLREIIDTIEAPNEIVRLAKQLDYNSLITVGIALKREAPDVHWVYVPDRTIIFHRYAWLSNYSPHNIPNRSFSTLLVEMTFHPKKMNNLRIEKIVDEVIKGLENLGIINKDRGEILFYRVWMHRYGYPVHTHRTNFVRRQVLDYLHGIGIMTIGRWGTWRYLNMDRILEEAKELTQKLINNDRQ